MKVLLKNVNVVDVENNRVNDSQCILVDAGKVAAVESQCSPEAAMQYDQVYDLSGHYVIPGIVNLHQHYFYKRTFGPLWDQFRLPIPVLTVRALKNAMAEFKEGITTARVLGSLHQIDLSLKYLFQHNFVLGPRLFVAGKPLSITGGHAAALSQCITGEDEFRRWTRERVTYVDWVKTFASRDPVEIPGEEFAKPEISLNELKVIVEEARNAGKKVAAHTVGTEALANVIEAGVDSVEHGVYLNRSLAREMKARNIALVPTLTAFTETINPRYNRGAEWIRLHEVLIKPNQDAFIHALEEGVLVGMGLDSLGDLQGEMELMKEISGLSNIEVLKICTLNGAKVLGMENALGSIVPGKIADMVVLSKNPADDLRNVGAVEAVMKEGNLVFSSDIRLSTRFEDAEYNSVIPELLRLPQ